MMRKRKKKVYQADQLENPAVAGSQKLTLQNIYVNMAIRIGRNHLITPLNLVLPAVNSQALSIHVEEQKKDGRNSVPLQSLKNTKIGLTSNLSLQRQNTHVGGESNS